MSLVAFDKIVPFGQDFVFDDMPCTLAFKKWVTFFLCLIDSSVDRCEHGESRFGCRPGRQFACLLDGVDDGSTPGIGDLREEPATGEALSLDYLPDYIWTNLYMALLREYPLDFGGSQTEPFCIGILRKPRYIKFYYLAEYGDILGMLGERALPATSLLADSALFEVLTRIGRSTRVPSEPPCGST